MRERGLPQRTGLTGQIYKHSHQMDTYIHQADPCTGQTDQPTITLNHHPLHLRFSATPRSSFSNVGGSAAGTISSTACRLSSLLVSLPSSPSGFGMVGCLRAVVGEVVGGLMNACVGASSFFLFLSCALLSGQCFLWTGKGKGKACEFYVNHHGKSMARVHGWLWVESTGWQATDSTGGFFRIHDDDDDHRRRIIALILAIVPSHKTLLS